MRAAVYHGTHDVRFEDVAEPAPGPGEVLVKVAYNGICGSDLYEYYAGPLGIPVEPHPLTGARMPVIMGHEFGGWVAGLGEGVEDLEIGTLVAVDPIHHCGTCGPCRRGAKNLCMIAAFHGLMAHGGGLSERTVVGRSMVHPMPDGMTPRHAALVEPMAVAFRAVRRAEVAAGQRVLILGAGPIGLGAYFAAKWSGAEPIVSEPSPVRRSILQGLGASHVLDPSVDDVVAAVQDMTGGEGVDASIDAVAHESTMSAGMAATRRGGNFVLVGIPHTPLPFNGIQMFMNEVTLRASNAYADDFQATIDAMAHGAYPLGDWISTIPLDGLIDDGFETLRAGRAMKILVDVGSGESAG
jgi:(R,R)-butanediol dehydrogenase/meso-butanediol dehydrogenase/diacetyl reductase